MKDYKKQQNFPFFEKVVSPNAMASIEKKAIAEGASALAFMEKASFEMAKEIELNYCRKEKKTKIFLLVGRGNNGGDALCIGSILLSHGYDATAYLLFEEDSFSPLLKQMQNRFLSNGGKVVPFYSGGAKLLSDSAHLINKDDIFIDGIFGTGFKGEISTEIISFIKEINEINAIKIAIDIPTGLDGESGRAIKNIAFKSDITFYLGLPKCGFFLNDGPSYIRKMIKIDFGLPLNFIEEINPKFLLIKKEKLSTLLPSMSVKQDKYKAGYLTAIAGSAGMEGAANLAGRAAMRSGSGIVKIFIAKDSGEKISDEIIKLDINLSNENIVNLLNSSSAIFIGPGIGRGKDTFNKLLKILPKITKPLVLDADGLFFLKDHLDLKISSPVILTPHKNEMEKLLHENELTEIQLIEKAKNFSEKYNKIVVLKGPSTMIFRGQDIPLIANFADPGMATAGSGDVLTGIISSFLAQGVEDINAAILGVGIHSIAGTLAAKEKTSYGIIASDIIEKIPSAIKKILHENYR